MTDLENELQRLSCQQSEILDLLEDLTLALATSVPGFAESFNGFITEDETEHNLRLGKLTCEEITPPDEKS